MEAIIIGAGAVFVLISVLVAIWFLRPSDSLVPAIRLPRIELVDQVSPAQPRYLILLVGGWGAIAFGTMTAVFGAFAFIVGRLSIVLEAGNQFKAAIMAMGGAWMVSAGIPTVITGAAILALRDIARNSWERK